MRQISGAVGRMAMASAAARSQEKAPVRSRQSASGEIVDTVEVTRLSTLKAQVRRIKIGLAPLKFA